jgi:hypothetical protein
MSNRSSKLKHELLVPGEHGWELWQGAPNTALTKTRDFDGLPGAFATAAARRTLALPAASLWVLPAWLKGDEATLRDIAQLHLERLRVRTPDHAEALQVESLRAEDDSHLASIVALKDIPTPITDFRLLPDECRLSAACFKLPPDAIILWRELGKLVIAITVGSRLAYFSPMSAASLDHQGIAELNNICLQLTFQKVLTQLNGILLWTEEGDLNRIQTTTGLTVARHDRPEPQMLGRCDSDTAAEGKFHPRTHRTARGRARHRGLRGDVQLRAVECHSRA